MIERGEDDPLLPVAKTSVGAALDPGTDLSFTLDTGEFNQPAGTDAANSAKADADLLSSGMGTSSPGIVGEFSGPGGAPGSQNYGDGGTGAGIGGARRPAPVSAAAAPAAPAPIAPPASSLHSLINYHGLAAYRATRGLPPIQAPPQPPQQRLGIGRAVFQGVR